jgi:flagellar biosynthesis/type III secretory pathway protein FliH
MRPKSPFLQNLRKKKPEPKMSKQVSTPIVKSPSFPEGFQEFKLGDFNEDFVQYSLEKPVDPEDEIPEEPPIDLDAERKEAYDKGFAKAKSEYEKYKRDSEILEKNFQELLLNMEEARHQWVHEVRVSVASSIQIALQKILNVEALQVEILKQKLADALENLADEKKMKVIVGKEFKDVAKDYLKDRPGWSVHVNDDVNGGAILESDSGIWDARLSVTLDEIEHLIQTWLVEKGGE